MHYCWLNGKVITEIKTILHQWSNGVAIIRGWGGRDWEPWTGVSPLAWKHLLSWNNTLMWLNIRYNAAKTRFCENLWRRLQVLKQYEMMSTCVFVVLITEFIQTKRGHEVLPATKPQNRHALTGMWNLSFTVAKQLKSRPSEAIEYMNRGSAKIQPNKLYFEGINLSRKNFTFKYWYHEHAWV